MGVVQMDPVPAIPPGVIKPAVYLMPLTWAQVWVIAEHLKRAGLYMHVKDLLDHMARELDRQDFEEAQRRIQAEASETGASLAAQFAAATGLDPASVKVTEATAEAPGKIETAVAALSAA